LPRGEASTKKRETSFDLTERQEAFIVFSWCKIQLAQRTRPGTINPSDVVGIKLTKPVAGATGKDAASISELVQAIAQGYNWSGPWRPMDTATIGTGAIHADGTHFWRYSVARHELEFVERERWSGSGEHGTLNEQIRRIAVLRLANLTSRGIEPIGDVLTEGPGELLYDDLNFLKRGPISWNYLINY
jgi:hypothetical protein